MLFNQLSRLSHNLGKIIVEFLMYTPTKNIIYSMTLNDKALGGK